MTEKEEGEGRLDGRMIANERWKNKRKELSDGKPPTVVHRDQLPVR